MSVESKQEPFHASFDGWPHSHQSLGDPYVWSLLLLSSDRRDAFSHPLRVASFVMPTATAYIVIIAMTFTSPSPRYLTRARYTLSPTFSQTHTTVDVSRDYQSPCSNGIRSTDITRS
ncbi:unnamed protein product [Sphacelaria rigidula]